MEFLVSVFCVVNIFALFSKRKIQIYLSWIITFLTLWITSGWCYLSLDTYNYISSFERASISNLSFGQQPLWQIMMFVARSVGIDYYLFQALVCLTSVLLLLKVVSNYLDNAALVFLLYFLFPFFLDSVLVRNFLGYSIVVYAIDKYLVDESMKCRFFKYITLVAIAGMIHVSMYSYLAFAINFIPFIYSKWRTRISLVTVTIGFAVFFKITSGSTFLTTLLESFLGERRSAILTAKTEWGFLLYWGVQFAALLLVYMGVFFAQASNQKEQIRLVKLSRVLWSVQLFLPLYIFSFDMYRLQRNLMILFYVIYIGCIRRISSAKVRALYTLGVIGFTLVVFFLMLFPQFQDTVIMTLEHNSLLR